MLQVCLLVHPPFLPRDIIVGDLQTTNLYWLCTPSPPRSPAAHANQVRTAKLRLHKKKKSLATLSSDYTPPPPRHLRPASTIRGMKWNALVAAGGCSVQLY
jgi:hypothetical protein